MLTKPDRWGGQPASADEFQWVRCDCDGCSGAAVAEGRCIPHAPKQLVDEVLLHWRDGAPLDARGVTVDACLLQRLVDALTGGAVTPQPEPREPDRRRVTVQGAMHFDRAVFVDCVDLRWLDFAEPAYFDGATFLKKANFNGALFAAHADFDRVTFEDAACFGKAIFEDHAGFGDASFIGPTSFRGAKFRSYADFEGAKAANAMCFKEATFGVVRQIGPLLVSGPLVLEDCVFTEHVTVEVAADEVRASGARFADGVRLLVRRATVALEHADFGRPSTLSRATSWSAAVVSRSDAPQVDEPQPRLSTLRGAQVSTLSLSDIDLRTCRFFGAHGLESLNIEPSCRWPRTPASALVIDRQILAEEANWRREVARHGLARRAWGAEALRSGGETDDEGPRATESEYLQPEQLAALYRALRKAREDNKDQAGASDLYYGEMDMRRHVALPAYGERGRTRACCDKAILTLYWLVAGYGSRASRAFLSLLVVLAASALALQRWGFTRTPPLSRGVLFATESTSSLLRVAHASRYRITTDGEAIELVLRFLGPLLIGLALLALRSRVKR